MVILEVLEYYVFVHAHLVGDLVPDFGKVSRRQGNVVVDKFLVVFELHIFLLLQDTQNSLL